MLKLRFGKALKENYLRLAGSITVLLLTILAFQNCSGSFETREISSLLAEPGSTTQGSFIDSDSNSSILSVTANPVSTTTDGRSRTPSDTSKSKKYCSNQAEPGLVPGGKKIYQFPPPQDRTIWQPQAADSPAANATNCRIECGRQGAKSWSFVVNVCMCGSEEPATCQLSSGCGGMTAGSCGDSEVADLVGIPDSAVNPAYDDPTSSLYLANVTVDATGKQRYANLANSLNCAEQDQITGRQTECVFLCNRYEGGGCQNMNPHVCAPYTLDDNGNKKYEIYSSADFFEDGRYSLDKLKTNVSLPYSKSVKKSAEETVHTIARLAKHPNDCRSFRFFDPYFADGAIINGETFYGVRSWYKASDIPELNLADHIKSLIERWKKSKDFDCGPGGIVACN